MPILPNGCPLPRIERDLIYDTYRKGEVPCLGCWRRHDCGAAMGDDLAVVAEVMGIPLEELLAEQGAGGSRPCERCGAEIEEWVIEGGGRERVWRCRGEIIDRIQTKKRVFVQKRACNWSIAEVASGGRGFMS